MAFSTGLLSLFKVDLLNFLSGNFYSNTDKSYIWPEGLLVAPPDQYNEQLLFQEIATGSEVAFRKLVSVYVPFLQPTLRRILKDEIATDDVIQETFIRIWICRDKLPDIENPRSWVLRIAYYRAFNHMRGRQLRRKTLESLPSKDPASDNALDDLLAFNTLSRLVNTAVSQMPPQQKKIYLLNREHGMSISQISIALDISPQTVKNTLGRAVAFIRDFLQKQGYVLSILPLILI